MTLKDVIRRTTEATKPELRPTPEEMQPQVSKGRQEWELQPGGPAREEHIRRREREIQRVAPPPT